MYADYNYYLKVYCAALKEPGIEENHIEWYLKKASAFLDSLFLYRKPKKPYDCEISDACCEIADCLFRLEKIEGIEREENDGYSVTFSNASSSPYKAAYDIAVRHLGLSGLLYRGLER